MPIQRGALGQLAPMSMVLVDLYSVPIGKEVTGRVIVTNRVGTDASFRTAIAVGGEADDPKQYIAYDKVIAAKDTGSTIAFMAGSGDVIRVYASNANLSFTFTGIEQDQAQ